MVGRSVVRPKILQIKMSSLKRVEPEHGIDIVHEREFDPPCELSIQPRLGLKVI